ncbi:MAG: hypothetical protein GWN21_18820 [Gammaproteobacteria bacterium]|nr:hypothetical protein [Gammaproteobacteria bacterium]NIP90451.1 hypothetical protein [Gammaproteobacteria bacterium]NIR25079.1 hypothetical protein [Gammaproteobacteria bacterium]NIS06780.1 hypothetical protein [Gammaproteobacteria bacterium]NIU41410.1 hypothetical protein [Gammaproteobacteria bacterium]
MKELFFGFVALLTVAALLATIGIWSQRRLSIRTSAVILTALLIPIGYLTVTELLSQPKPMHHEWFKRHVDEATLLGVSVREGEAIYLWLRLDDSLEPRYYVLPWQRQLAEKLQNLVDEAIRDGAAVVISNPFSRESFDNLGDMNVKIIRPPQMPLKPPLPPPQFFNPRERST